MKIALVHEYLTQLGGAERVLENFLEIWPDATLYLLVYDKNKTEGRFEKVRKVTSFLDKFPFVKNHHKLFLALMPAAIESFRFDDFDLVLSDSSSFAKGVITKKPHICYCHTPTRFVWTESENYMDKQPYPEILKACGRLALKYIKKWDLRASQRPDFFIANSKNVQDRIKKFYGRGSEVIYPPVDTDFFSPTGGGRQDYYLVASRLEPYKKVDLVIEAFNDLKLPLKVAGIGTQLGSLKKIARGNIEFLGRVSDKELKKLYSEAKAFVFPAEEDAGIMMLEAQSCGTPVVAFRKGGALELVKENVTGIYFNEQTSAAIKQAITEFKPEIFDPSAIRQFALQFDKKEFQKNIRRFVEEKSRQLSGVYSKQI
ncbi:MAG: glycosyltransferase [Acidobacteriaceae bacterium]